MEGRMKVRLPADASDEYASVALVNGTNQTCQQPNCGQRSIPLSAHQRAVLHWSPAPRLLRAAGVLLLKRREHRQSLLVVFQVRYTTVVTFRVPRVACPPVF
jgi:hypothetical protein